jgi:hypothetical protein
MTIHIELLLTMTVFRIFALCNKDLVVNFFNVIESCMAAASC